MLLHKPELTKEQARQQRQRCDRFAAAAADVIGDAGDCLFSLLPYEERRRQAASWYDACAQAMLHCNFAPLEEWMRRQSCLAAEERFELQDLLRLLRICRRSAIEIDGWDEDVFSAVDDVINEGLLAIRVKVSWNIPDNLNYLKEAGTAPASPPLAGIPDPLADAEVRAGERRVSGRNQLALPIRVRCNTGRCQSDETTRTLNVSLTGLYFRTLENYRPGTPLHVTYPFWTAPGSINREYSARITRVDRLSDGSWGVAVEFLQNLREKSA